MSEKITPSPIERREATTVGRDTADGLITRVEELLDRGDGRFHDKADHEEARRMLRVARMLAAKNPQVIQEIDRLSANIEDIHK